jgi:shikimate 5-dehydrogenase
MNPQIIAALIGAGGSAFAGLATAAVAATAIWATGRSTDKAIAAQRTVAEEQRLWERQAEVYLEALAWMASSGFKRLPSCPRRLR